LWGSGKTELILSPRCDLATFHLRLHTFEEGLPHIVTGLSDCLGVPRYPANDPHIIDASLESLGVRHDRLLDLAEVVAYEDPFVVLRLLEVCGIQRFGQIISTVPPLMVADFARSRDEVVQTTFAAIQQEPPPSDSTNSLPVGAGGAVLTSLARDSSGSYLNAFFRVAGALHQRLVAFDDVTNRNVASMLTDPVKANDSLE